MVRDIDDTLFIATTAYDQVNNSSFIEILKLDPNDVLVAKLDIEPSVGQNIQVFHINNGHDGNLCITGLVEEAGRNHIYAAILSTSLTILHEKYYEYPHADPDGMEHSQGHFIAPISSGGYIIGGMATDGYNFNQSEMLDSKVGIVMSVGHNLNFGVASSLNSRFDCDWTVDPFPLGSPIPPALPYLAPMSPLHCDTTPDPSDDYDLVDHIIEYEPMKFLITGSVNVPHNASGTKDFDQGVLFYGLNVGCGTGPPYLLCMGFEFNLSFTTGLGPSYNEDENSVETIYYPNSDEAVVLVNSGQRHGLVLASYSNLSNSTRKLSSGIEIHSFTNPFEWPVSSSMKKAQNTPTPDGVVIGGQFRETSYTFPSDPPGSYNHSFPFILHVDRKDASKTNFFKTYPLRSHDFEAHFPNNMNHILARGIENVPLTFTPPSLLTEDLGPINRKTELLMYKIEPSTSLSQLGKFSVNYTGSTECMQHIDLNPTVNNYYDFFQTTLIDQELVWFTQHPIQSPTESRDLIEEPCIAE